MGFLLPNLSGSDLWRIRVYRENITRRRHPISRPKLEKDEEEIEEVKKEEGEWEGEEEESGKAGSFRMVLRVTLVL